MNQNLHLLDGITKHVQEIVNAETAVVAIAEAEGEIVHYAAAAGKHADAILDRRGAAATSGLCGVAFQGKEPVLVCSTEGDRRVRQDQVKALGIYTALAAPLYYENKLLGALMALNRTDGNLFDQHSERVLVEYAKEAAPLVHQYQTTIE